MLGPVALGNQNIDRLPEKLVLRIAEHAFDFGIDQDDNASRLDHDHARRA